MEDCVSSCWLFEFPMITSVTVVANVYGIYRVNSNKKYFWVSAVSYNLRIEPNV